METKEHLSTTEPVDLRSDAIPNDQQENNTAKDLQQDHEMLARTSKFPDRSILCSWSMVIVLLSFLSCCIVGIMYISFSVFYIYFVEDFGADKATTGWIGSLFLATGNLLGIVYSVFIKFYGCRLVAVVGGFTWFFGFAISSLAPSITFLYFSYGFIAGMGFNMVTLSSFVIVQHYFEKHRALAAGMAATGISVGTLIGAPIVGYFIETYGWRGALLIIAGIAANCSVLGSLYRPVTHLKVRISQADKDATVDDEKKNSKIVPTTQQKDGLGKVLIQLGKDMTNFTLFRNSTFTLTCFGTFFMNVGMVIFYQHTPSRAVFLGMEKRQAVLLPAAIGVSTLIARVFGSVVGNLSCTNRLLQYGVCILLGGILLIVNAYMDTFTTIAVVGAAIGFLGGCALTVQTTVMSDLVGVQNVARAAAFVLVFTGIGALIAVPLAGFIYDKTHNYSIPFYTGGILQMFGGILVVISAAIKRYNETRVIKLIV